MLIRLLPFAPAAWELTKYLSLMEKNKNVLELT